MVPDLLKFNVPQNFDHKEVLSTTLLVNFTKTSTSYVKVKSTTRSNSRTSSKTSTTTTTTTTQVKEIIKEVKKTAQSSKRLISNYK